ncbi:MAG: hypothetical protein JXL81_07700 [Deltaproteobacteria bacterium]|nr:hypothetical protein [Deltaproteobacteria bacterium]
MKKESKTPGKTRKPLDPAKKLERLIEKLKEKTPLHYTMSGSFKKDDVIDHDTFGKGVVIDSDFKKIDVLFSDKLRTLVCDR